MYSGTKEPYSFFYLHDEELILPESGVAVTLGFISYMGPEENTLLPCQTVPPFKFWKIIFYYYYYPLIQQYW